MLTERRGGGNEEDNWRGEEVKGEKRGRWKSEGKDGEYKKKGKGEGGNFYNVFLLTIKCLFHISSFSH